MSNQSVRFAVLVWALVLPASCTKYTVAPDAGDGGDARSNNDRANIDLSSADQANTDASNDDRSTTDVSDNDRANTGGADAPMDVAVDSGSTCADPTRADSCGVHCTVCPVPLNADHATCDGTTCGVICKSGFHACGDQCLDNMSLNSCGTACGACTAPTGGSATCDGQTCGMACLNGQSLCGTQCQPSGAACNGACASGTHNCSGQCQSNSDTNFCGTDCAHCSAPQNGSAVCNGACGVQCNNGFNLCGTACKAKTDPTACGPNCIHCDAPTGGTATCDGTKCGTPTCPNGQQNCNNACIDSNRSCNGACGNGGYNCPDGVCRTTNTVFSCGTACQPCASKVNATATSCTNGVCGYTCNSGYLQCGDGTCSRSTWNFEDGTVEGFAEDTIPDDNATITVINGGHSGAKALSSQYAAPSFVQVYIGAIVGGLCGANGLPAQGRTASGWVRLSGSFEDATSCELEYFTADTDVDFTAGQEVTGVLGQWTHVTVPLASPMVYRLRLRCFTHATAAGTLQMDIDDVTIQ
ncbi:MAG TPA: hypothetical protein VGL59_00695 [Polyangia bacterium]|jgi:hypothetical protein